MDAVTFDLLSKKLKNAPQSVLEHVIVYVDTLIELQQFLKRTH